MQQPQHTTTECVLARRSHLEASYGSQETEGDLELLRQQAAEDAKAGLAVPPIP